MEQKTYNLWYHFLTWYYYFNVGFGRLNVVKYFVALLGWAINDAVKTIIIAFVYCLVCLFLGRWWVLHKLMDMENDIANQFNPFCKDVRKAIKSKNI